MIGMVLRSFPINKQCSPIVQINLEPGTNDINKIRFFFSRPNPDKLDSFQYHLEGYKYLNSRGKYFILIAFFNFLP